MRMCARGVIWRAAGELSCLRHPKQFAARLFIERNGLRRCLSAWAGYDSRAGEVTMALVQVQTSGGEGVQPGVSAAAAQTSGTTPRWQVVAASFAAISAAWLVGIVINAAFKPIALAIPAGIGLFAMLYAVT